MEKLGDIARGHPVLIIATSYLQQTTFCTIALLIIHEHGVRRWLWLHLEELLKRSWADWGRFRLLFQSNTGHAYDTGFVSNLTQPRRLSVRGIVDVGGCWYCKTITYLPRDTSPRVTAVTQQKAERRLIDFFFSLRRLETQVNPTSD